MVKARADRQTLFTDWREFFLAFFKTVCLLDPLTNQNGFLFPKTLSAVDHPPATDNNSLFIQFSAALARSSGRNNRMKATVVHTYIRRQLGDTDTV